jgi:hypothetical protein
MRGQVLHRASMVREPWFVPAADAVLDLGVTVTGPESCARGLPRKEVIQPHLPVRLPCYDFVPIASPAFDGSAPCGFGHRLQASPTFMT